MKDHGRQSESFFRDLYVNNYILMQYQFIHLFAEHLADCSRVFGADLQMVLVLAILGQRTLDARIRREVFELGSVPQEVVPQEAHGINSSSIAEITGIPRETVRRKLEALAARGWIARDERGRWGIVADAGNARARTDLADLDQRQTDRVARFLANTHRIVAEAQAQGRQPDASAGDRQDRGREGLTRTAPRRIRRETARTP